MDQILQYSTTPPPPTSQLPSSTPKSLPPTTSEFESSPPKPVDQASPLSHRLAEALKQIDKLRAITGAPGIAIGVVHNGVRLLTKGLGYRDVEQQLIPNSDTKFIIGSVSKTFLSAAVSIAVAEGKLNLDSPLSKYLPHFHPCGDPRVASATIRQILQHTSGLGNPQILISGPQNSALQQEATFIDFVNQIPTSKRSGDRFGKWTYSNMGYGLVGLALQNVYSCRYADFLSQRILRPLGLSRTAVTRDEACDDQQPSSPSLPTPQKFVVLVEERETEQLSCTGNMTSENHQGLFAHCSTSDGRSYGSTEKRTCVNVAYPYARLQNGSHQRLICGSTTNENMTPSLAPMGIRSSVNDLLAWATAIISAEPQPPLSNINTIIQHNQPWSESPHQCAYRMGWYRGMAPTSTLGINGYNNASSSARPVMDVFPGNNILQANGIMNGSTCGVYAFVETQTIVVACANSASDGDAADWAAKILIQALHGPADPIDFLDLATREASARQEKYSDMLLRWEQGRDVQQAGVYASEFVGTYRGFGLSMTISHGNGESGNKACTLQLVFNGVQDSMQKLVWYSKDVWSYFPRTRDDWLGLAMINWDFAESGLLKFRRDAGHIVSLEWEWDDNENAVILFKEV